MKRTLNPKNLNTVVNHPEVRPYLRGPDGPLDVTAFVVNPANYVFEITGGGFICIAMGNGIYEVHSQFVPEARKHSLKTMRDSMDYMFTRTDCTMLVSHFPEGNQMAESIGRKGGFKPTGISFEDGPFAGCELRAVLLDDWVAANPTLEADGHDFHTLVEAAKTASGSVLAVHADDATHDRFVGAASRMIRRGNAIKGVQLYNRWAVGAGYAEIDLLSVNPPLIDVKDAIVGLTTDGQVEVLLCR